MVRVIVAGCFLGEFCVIVTKDHRTEEVETYAKDTRRLTGALHLVDLPLS